MGEIANTATTAKIIPDTIAANDPRLALRFDDMEEWLSYRCYTNLKNGKILTVRDLFSRMNEDLIRNGDITWLHTEKSLLRIPKFGCKSLSELKDVLALHGLRIGMRIVAADAAALTPETVNGLTLEIQGRVEMVTALLDKSMSYIKAITAVGEICSVEAETSRALLIRGLEGHPPDQQIVFLVRLQERAIEHLQRWGDRAKT